MKEILTLLEAMTPENEKELQKAVSRFVNSFSFDHKELVAEIQQSEPANANFRKIVAWWVTCLACMQNFNYYYDGRNEIAVRKGTEISNHPAFLAFQKQVLGDIDATFEVSKMFKSWNAQKLDGLTFCQCETRDHRTLQQSFSKIVFYYLNETVGSFDFNSETWWRMPLI